MALIFSTEPLFAAFCGFHLLGELLSPLVWVGGACILAGVLMAELMGQDPKQSQG